MRSGTGVAEVEVVAARGGGKGGARFGTDEIEPDRGWCGVDGRFFHVIRGVGHEQVGRFLFFRGFLFRPLLLLHHLLFSIPKAAGIVQTLRRGGPRGIFPHQGSVRRWKSRRVDADFTIAGRGRRAPIKCGRGVTFGRGRSSHALASPAPVAPQQRFGFASTFAEFPFALLLLQEPGVHAGAAEIGGRMVRKFALVRFLAHGLQKQAGLFRSGQGSGNDCGGAMEWNGGGESKSVSASAIQYNTIVQPAPLACFFRQLQYKYVRSLSLSR